MSPVSPVFHTVVTVSIGLKNGIPDRYTEPYPTNNAEQNLGMLVVLLKLSVPLHLLCPNNALRRREMKEIILKYKILYYDEKYLI